MNKPRQRKFATRSDGSLVSAGALGETKFVVLHLLDLR